VDTNSAARFMVGGVVRASCALLVLWAVLALAICNLEAADNPPPPSRHNAGRHPPRLQARRQLGWIVLGQGLRTIQAALTAVPDDHGGHRILVAADTYMEAKPLSCASRCRRRLQRAVGDSAGRLGSGTSGW